MRLSAGQPAPLFTVSDLNGRQVSATQYRGVNLLISFHRFAVCPLCDLRLWHLTRRAEEYRAQGLYQLTFVESIPNKTDWYLNRLRCPFPIIPDLRGTIYRLYGVEASALGIARGLLLRQGAYREAGRQHLGGWNVRDMDGRFTRMPASFIIDPSGRIALAYYGKDSGDFLPFKTLDEYVARQRQARRGHAPSWPGTSDRATP